MALQIDRGNIFLALTEANDLLLMAELTLIVSSLRRSLLSHAVFAL
jgi:hypothetical protein